MSRLEELIEKLCPDGVEHKKIAEIADTFIGLATSVTKYKSDKGVMLLHNSDIKDGKIEIKNLEFITEDFAQKNSKKILRKNDVITVHTGDVGTSAVITEEYDGTIGFTTISSRIKDTSEITPEYLCKYLNSHLCKVQITSKTISDRNNLNLASFDELIIPVPPLEVQSEIVRILDNFTELTAELTDKLTAELTARKKQYEYYRDELFSFEEDNRVLITEIAYTYIGLVTTMTKHYAPTGVKLIHNSSVKENRFEFKDDTYLEESFAIQNQNRRHKVGDIITVHTGDVGTSAIIKDDLDGSLGFATIVTRLYDTSKILPEYVCYYLNSHDNKQNIVSMIKGDRNNLNLKDFNKLTIPVPPLEEQQRIVDILDRFDKLCNDISEGLPAEIEARQKQYEYYRDKLLTFKEL